MRQFALALVATLGLVSVATGGTIDGKIAGWSGNLLSRQLAVVWLEGVQTPATSKNEPVMAQFGGQFVPPFLVVVAGQTVNMPNEDEVAHNVYSVSAAKEFNLGYYAKGQPKAVTFDRPGMVEVQCLIHGFMRAKILVLPNPYYSRIATDGSFHIRKAPAGKYALTFWGEKMASFSEEVQVPAGGKPLTVHLPLPATTPQK